jgi:diadenosine tetraphosphate (Ap4A) HIT family hydrolase
MVDRGSCGCFQRDFVVQTFRHWRLSVSRQQGFLGWCLIILTRHCDDPADLTPEEVAELWSIMRSVRNGLSEIFQPDRFNYAFLANVVRHVHMHVMPRYQTPRTFLDTEYIDKQWGWFAIPGTEESPEEMLSELKRLLLERLES